MAQLHELLTELSAGKHIRNPDMNTGVYLSKVGRAGLVLNRNKDQAVYYINLDDLTRNDWEVVNQPLKLRVGGIYLLRCGKRCKVLEIDKSFSQPVTYRDEDSNAVVTYIDGRLDYSKELPWDIIEEVME